MLKNVLIYLQFEVICKLNFYISKSTGLLCCIKDTSWFIMLH